MNRGLSVVVAGMLFAVGTILITAGGAFATISETLGVDKVDVFQFQCTHTNTHCMGVELCDTDGPDLVADKWQVTSALYAPLTLIGRASTDTLVTAAANVCMGNFVTVCRSGTSHGPMKALVTVTHPSGSGSSYNLLTSCTDVHNFELPSANTKITIKTDQ